MFIERAVARQFRMRGSPEIPPYHRGKKAEVKS